MKRYNEVVRAPGRRALALLVVSTSMLALATVVSPANAQGIAVSYDLTIPDLPCMTAAERRRLQDLANQESLLRGRRNSITAQRSQLLNDPAYTAAQDLIRAVDRRGYFNSSDERLAYNDAKRLVADVNAKNNRLTRQEQQLDRQRRDLEVQFRTLIEAIRRRCYTPPTIPLILPAPGPIEPISSPTPFIAMEGGMGWSGTDFNNVVPPFGINGSSGVFGVNGGILFPMGNSALQVGPRLGGMWGNMTGQIEHPQASPGATYTASTRSIYYGEALFRINYPILSTHVVPTHIGMYYFGSIGVAAVNTRITGISNAFDVSASTTKAGFTASAGIGIPILPQFDLGIQYRYINVRNSDVLIPGQVNLSGDRHLLTFSLNYAIRLIQNEIAIRQMQRNIGGP